MICENMLTMFLNSNYGLRKEKIEMARASTSSQTPTSRTRDTDFGGGLSVSYFSCSKKGARR